ncbi:hypothetical protein MSAN_01112700 [Mycena sanguinolenta]|uniref:CxC2-like cysteine cluster KDZ transposase-associated domain-containing protein n=1 Tax=Mycena sanguinolenta TaxID=230812 RepID=A0A8H7D3I8_9AGAR|nr:hypothetical protein MSAN_01112700 [Mycena sanguinolenta]
MRNARYRSHLHPPPSTLPPAQAPSQAAEQKRPEEPAKLRKQGASVAMAEVTPLLREIQDALLSTHYHRDIGSPCAMLEEPDAIREIVVVHENGFHRVVIDFCSCPKNNRILDQWKQLLNVRLFPATWKRPTTVFTFAVMDQFHIHSLTSKKSAYDYVRALAKLTNNAFPQDVENRCREFQHSFRIWRFLALQRRTGQAHEFDKYVPHRAPKSLTIRCPACPEVGYNIDQKTIDEAEESEKQVRLSGYFFSVAQFSIRHKYTLYVSTDGNFKLQRKNKLDDPDDVALNNGHGYFVNTAEFQKYLDIAKPLAADETDETCSHFRAARLQNVAKFKNAVITGVVAVQCVRHGFYLPNGMVDLKRGEAYANTDYAICHGLSEATNQRWIMLLYDIWCQYHRNLKTRVKNWFGNMLTTIEKFRRGIPKMHIHNHQDFACTVGEMIETGWAEQNLTAGSTKEQNDGHRHDSIDETSGHWNWDKLIKITDTLVRLYRLNELEIRDREFAFEKWSASRDPRLVAGWEQEEVMIESFEAKLEHGPPTHAAAYRKLAEEELANVKAGLEAHTGDTALIATALMVERDQVSVRRLVAAKEEENIIRTARGRLSETISNLRMRQVQRVPELAKHMRDIDVEKPEHEVLFLPSNFNAATRDDLKLKALSLIEYELREANAYQHLEDLRNAIRVYNINYAFKRTHLHGTGATTKAANYLKTLYNDVQIHCTNYRITRAALLKLGLPRDDKALQPLKRDELRGKDGKEQAPGQAKEKDPWFWKVGRPSGLSVEQEQQWSTEMDRVRWFRLRALLQRALEERETLLEEFARTRESFIKSATIWRALAEQKVKKEDKQTDEHEDKDEDEDEENRGKRAYASKQCAMYSELADRCFAAHGKLSILVAEDLAKQIAKEEREQQNKEQEEQEDPAEQSMLPDEEEDLYPVVTIVPHENIM